jgi:hypothetical protein
MEDTTLISFLLTPGGIMDLAVRTVISGIILFLTSRLVGARGGLLAAMGVAFLNILIMSIVFEIYIFPLMAYDSQDIATMLQTNILGFVLAGIMPGLIWGLLVMVLMKVGPLQAGMIAFVQWLLGLALSYFGLLLFLKSFL